MPNWKKVVTSGSNAILNEITSSGGIYSAEDIYSRESKLGRDTYIERLLTLGTEPSEDTTTNTSIQFLSRDKNNGEIKHHTLGSNAFNSTAFTTCVGDITQVCITAGDGLTGDVNTTSGNHLQTIDVDSTVVRTSGTQTIGGDKTFTGAVTINGTAEFGDPVTLDSDLTLTGISTNTGHSGALVIDGTTGQVYSRTLGSNAFNSTAFTTCTGTSCLTLTGGVDNRIVTAGSTTSLIGESNLTYDGSTLTVGTKAKIGATNSLSGNSTSILGGHCNSVGSSAHCSTIANGFQQTISGYNSFIGGGGNGCIEGNHSVIAGGCKNFIKYCENFIGGGCNNCIGTTSNCSDRASVIVGGSTNTIFGGASGGTGNCKGNFIGGGISNTLYYSDCAVIVGGCSNSLYGGQYSFLGGGYDNYVANKCSVVVGGATNSNYALLSSILGGASNTIGASSCFSAILGGAANIINHNCSFIAGQGITTDKSNYFFVNNLDVNSNIIGSTLSLTGLSAQNSEATAVMINGSNVVGTRELGSNAFNSTAFTSCTGTVTSVSSADTNKIYVGGTATAPTIDAKTGAVTNGALTLATGDQIYDHVTTRISGLTTCTGTSCLTLTGGVNNRIVTAGSTTSLIGESGLTYDGSTFYSNAQGNNFERSVTVGDDNAGYGCLVLGDDYHGGELGLQNTNDCMIAIIAGADKFEYASKGSPGNAAICAHTATACNYSIKLGNAANHIIESTCSTIGGGSYNCIKGTASCLSFIGGGYVNDIESSALGVVGSGWGNCITGSSMSGIVGGKYNTIKSKTGSGNFIGGGQFNQIWKATATGELPGCELNSSIVGGSSNVICNGTNGVSNSCGYNFIGGGLQNKMCYTSNTFIGGGCCNVAISAFCSVIAGGCCNLLYNSYNFIGGGFSNGISCKCSVVVGGHNNSNQGITSFIGGGRNNTITNGSNCSSITAGYYNSITGCLHNSIGAGCQNTICASTYGTSNRIGGGQLNDIRGTNVSYNTIPGGWCNKLCNTYCSTIAGGRSNCIKDKYLSTIGGGGSNYVCGRASTITGGENNCICNGAYGCASILGGCNNRICTAPFASAVGLANIVNHSCSHAIGAGLTSTTTLTTYMNNATVACHLQVGGTTTLNTTTGRIDATNDVISFATSDRRLKENIKPIENALCKVIGVSGNTFDWKPLTKEEIQTIHGNSGRDVGVIAQEIESILPEAVTTRDSGYKAVNYEKIVPLLIEAIKDQQKQIDELKSKL